MAKDAERRQAAAREQGGVRQPQNPGAGEEQVEHRRERRIGCPGRGRGRAKAGGRVRSDGGFMGSDSPSLGVTTSVLVRLRALPSADMVMLGANPRHFSRFRSTFRSCRSARPARNMVKNIPTRLG